MGAWGYEPLENDGALDFINDWANSADYELLEEHLDEIESLDEDFVQAELGEALIAAAHVISCILDEDVSDLFEDSDLQDWVEELEAPKMSMVRRLRKALIRLLEDESEIHEQWSESDDARRWEAGVRDLIKQLS